MNRRAIRLRTLLSARISFGAIEVDCEVRDISTCGARLALPPGVPLPHHFDLFILQRRQTRKCRLVWFSEGQCGVEFLDQEIAPDARESEPTLFSRMAQLEAELALMRNELREVRRELQARTAPIRKIV